ncbi:MAG: SUMF1/EgtB/PvdO family nonheme iron enzyme [Bryobacterales bacterium]|nr:SUMF1/EgtB/PvdO family nonheme iron enzyme [Bryobacterales bacterium]
MARIKAVLMLLASVVCVAGWGVAQPVQDARFRAAGVCGRCHVVSVLEWGGSRHFKEATGCVACHGASEGHVTDERNNIKPDKIPHAAAIAGLCADCHAAGCAKTRRKDSCETCHNVHALADPRRPVDNRSPQWEAKRRQWAEAKALADEGSSLMKRGEWRNALAKLNRSLELHAEQPDVGRRVEVCRRRLNAAGLPGFEPVGDAYDPETGLPVMVVAKELGIRFALIPGGRIELGSAQFAASTPVHAVAVKPFYLAVHELTQAEWTALMGRNPSVYQGSKYPDAARSPVENVSWLDCQAAIARINGRVAGGGFRLPTEAEWEFAAKEGGESANDAFNLQSPRPVAAGSPNRFGIYDLNGNVWEWCSSLYRPYPYAPGDGREAADAKGLRVLRGGGYADSSTWFDASARFGERPDRRLRANGVRLARSVPE